MEDVIQELEDKIDRAVGEIGRLKGLLAEAVAQKEAGAGQIARLESRVTELESDAGRARGEYEERLSAFSGKIGDVLKKLDTVI